MESTFLSKIVIGMSIPAITFGLAYLFNGLAERNFRRSLRRLRKKIKKNWKNNKNIEKLDVKCENTVPLPALKDIQFYVKVISSEKFAKPKAEKSVAAPRKKVDPFAAEYRNNILIQELTDTHTLLYNKFPLVPYHVLVVTNQFENQLSLLNENDFHATLMVMKSLNCFVFFNGGANAGSSQEHKHLQAVPYSSFPNQAIPLDTIIQTVDIKYEENDNPVNYGTLPFFKFKHVLCRFNPSITKGMNTKSIIYKSKILRDAYLECLKRLNNTDLSIAYNFILTKRWLFVVLRKCEVALDMVKINAVGFTGSFAVRSDEEYEFVRNQDPINILHSITYPA